ncbi:MAG: uracil-DNA glycosylase, partial [Rickettsiales bacterium]
TAAKSMLDVTTGITRLRGKQHAYTNPYLQNPLPAFALFHPAYLLRQPHLKALAWRDLLQIKQVLGSQS